MAAPAIGDEEVNDRPEGLTPDRNDQ